MKHCWTDYRSTLAPEAALQCEVEGQDATCFLPEGHEGPHEWTLDRDGLRRMTFKFIGRDAAQGSR
jgi:hypothetical protein